LWWWECIHVNHTFVRCGIFSLRFCPLPH
jgi:hypothetical protein